MRYTKMLFVVAAMLMTGLSLGCGSEDEDTQPASSQSPGAGSYRGLLSGASETAVLAIEIQTAPAARALTPSADPQGPMAVTGTLTPTGGQPIPLTGTYDSTTKEFSVAGGGYSFSGSAESGAISGSYSGPNGSGSFTLLPSSSADVALFCGTYSGDASGTWNLAAVQAGAASGAFASSGGQHGTFAGSWSGENVTLSGSGVSANGSLTSTAGSGTWTAGSESGSWATVPCQ
jgi:hypothetical protein